MSVHLCLVNIILHLYSARSQQFKEADFVSDWLPLTAQSIAAEVDVDHGLGGVPDIVEVLVKATTGPNKGFTFKAMGTSERDDDTPDLYGGVVYIYNTQYVKVMAPRRCNQQSNGGAIYTGEAPYWTGVNSQHSFEALIQVRCWTNASLPAPCFNTFGIPLTAGYYTDTFNEIVHGVGRYPDVVKVRTRIVGGPCNTWYSDAQGSATGFSGRLWSSGGGIKYGYNDTVVRVWAWSHQGFQNYLWDAVDGWGNDCWTRSTGYGELEVTLWCNIGMSPRFETSLAVGPAVVGTDLELQFPATLDPPHGGDMLLSFMVRVEDGVNAGFIFEGVGSAKANAYTNPTIPCEYGGIIYAFSNTSLRMWRPDTSTGAAVCINENFGAGAKSQGAVNVTVIVRLWKGFSMKVQPDYRELPSLCFRFRRVAANSTYNSTVIGGKAGVTSLLECEQFCKEDLNCSTFTVSNSSCSTFSSYDENFLLPENGTQVWTMLIQ